MGIKIGDLFAGRYDVKSFLGRGGMGQVLEVADRKRKAPLALKLLNKMDPAWLELFRQEFSLLSASSHPHIVRVYDFGFDKETITSYYTAELLEGFQEKRLDVMRLQATGIGSLHAFSDTVNTTSIHRVMCKGMIFEQVLYMAAIKGVFQYCGKTVTDLGKITVANGFDK